MVESADKRGWGHPDSPGYRQKYIIPLRVAGVTLYVRKEVAPLFERFIEELTSGGRYTLNGRADDWGYANRDVRGRPGVKSNHAWGLAVDLNATTNPMTNDGRCHTDLPPGISKLAAKYGLRWGGDYAGRKDPMHFEFIGTPADAQAYVRHTSALSRPSQTSMERTMAKLDDEDLNNIKRIIDAEVNEIYWLLLGVPKDTPRHLRPTLKKIYEDK